MVGGECTSTRVQIWLNGTAWSPCAFFLYFFWVVVLNLILSWRSVIMAPEILKVGDIENATAQGWKESRETTRITKSLGFFLPQKGEIWDLGLKLNVIFW